MNSTKAPSPSLSDFVSGLGAPHRPVWSRESFHAVVRHAIHYFGARTVLELGGGRAPLFSPAQISQLGIDYVLNDISASELDRAPAGYDRKLCHDFSAGRPDIECDLIFSRMVHEHIADNRANLANQLASLRPGGVVIHLHPVLYSVPFLANRLLPDGISSRIIRRLYPFRGDDRIPKFPAHYHWCSATERQRQRILDLGYGECELIPFYGHWYYYRIPGAQRVINGLADVLARRDARRLATYCCTIARK